MKHKLITLMIMFSIGCATPMGVAPSNTPLAGKLIVKHLGKAEASTGFYTLYFPIVFPFGGPDLETAMKEMMATKKGNALINIHWYEQQYFFLFLSRTSVTIQAEVVQLEAKTYKPTK